MGNSKVEQQIETERNEIVNAPLLFFTFHPNGNEKKEEV